MMRDYPRLRSRMLPRNGTYESAASFFGYLFPADARASIGEKCPTTYIAKGVKARRKDGEECRKMVN